MQLHPARGKLCLVVCASFFCHTAVVHASQCSSILLEPEGKRCNLLPSAASPVVLHHILPLIMLACLACVHIAGVSQCNRACALVCCACAVLCCAVQGCACVCWCICQRCRSRQYVLRCAVSGHAGSARCTACCCQTHELACQNVQVEVPEWYVQAPRSFSPDAIRTTADQRAFNAAELENQEAINAFDITHGQCSHSTSLLPSSIHISVKLAGNDNLHLHFFNVPRKESWQKISWKASNVSCPMGSSAFLQNRNPEGDTFTFDGTRSQQHVVNEDVLSL